MATLPVSMLRPCVRPTSRPAAPVLRILLLASKLENGWTGGIGRVVRGQAEELARRGHSVRIAGPGAAQPGAISGVEIHRWPAGRRPVARVPGLVRELLTWNPDVVHIHSALPRWPVVSAAALVRAGRGRPRVVLTPHTGSRSEYRSRWSRSALRMADAVVTVSQWSADRAVSAGAPLARTAVVPPGFAMPEPTRRIQPSRTISVFARLTPSKGVDVAILGFDLASRSRPEWRLVIAGRGREVERLRRLAASLPTSDQIELTGWLGGDAKQRLLGETAIGLVPSRVDNLPASLLEFQAEGIACVCSQTGGLPEAAEQGLAGLLVPPGDVVGLARGLGRLMDDTSLRLRLAHRGRECALSRSWEASTERLLQVYGRLAEQDLELHQ